MTAIAMSPAELLFNDAEGKPTSLEDLIDDGLDGAYRDRVPALIELLHGGAPRDRLYACMVLTAWGVADGFTALILQLLRGRCDEFALAMPAAGWCRSRFRGIAALRSARPPPKGIWSPGLARQLRTVPTTIPRNRRLQIKVGSICPSGSTVDVPRGALARRQRAARGGRPRAGWGRTPRP
jgi:hypothetical protein